MCREELIDFDKYIISKDGTIISKHWNKPLTGWIDKDGYLVSCLTMKNGKQQPYRVNRVIAYLFVPRPEHLKDVPFEELQVGHWDINKKNNRIENLYWCTSKENNNNPLTKEKQRVRGLDENNIKKLRKSFETYIKNGGKGGFAGKHHSDEAKIKQSIAKTKYWDKHRLTDEERKKRRKEHSHKMYLKKKMEKKLII